MNTSRLGGRRVVSRRSLLAGLSALGSTIAGTTAAASSERPDANGTGSDRTDAERTRSTGDDATRTDDSAAAIYQYYHTDWRTITDDVPAIANGGYGAIQVPPAQASALTPADQDADDHPPLGYQPVDFRSFDSEFGTEAEYAAMVDTAHAHGLDVVADAVMNHMAGGRGYDFPAFSYPDFHHDGPIDYDDPESVENGDLLGMPDLDQDSAYVREQLYNYLETYATIGETGVDAVRYDAAKHIPESFFAEYANEWCDDLGLDRIGEVLHGADHVVDTYAQTGMRVLDYPLYFTMQEDVFHADGDLRTLDTAGYVKQNPSSVTFVSNHDMEPPDLETLAHAYLLTTPGQPRVYSKRIDVRDHDVRNLLWIRNTLASGPTITRHADRDLFVYERESNLLVGLNKTRECLSLWVPTSWNGRWLHDYTGHSTDTLAFNGGWTHLRIPPRSWVCYAPADAG